MSLGGLMGGSGAGGIGGMLGGMFGPIGAMIGQLVEKIVGQVLNQVIDELSKDNKMSDSSTENAKKAASNQLGQQDSTHDNMYEMLGQFQKETGASDADMGNVERVINDLKDQIKKMFNELNQQNTEISDPKKKKAGAHGGGQAAGGAGGAESTGGAGGGSSTGGAGDAGSTSSSNDAGGEDWFEMVAFALAKALGNQAQKVKDQSEALHNANTKLDAHDAKVQDLINSGKDVDDKGGASKEMKALQNEGKSMDRNQQEQTTRLQAASAKLGFESNSINATINALSDALKTAAQVK